MEKTISRILSVLLHPLLMPTYGVLLFFYLMPMTGIEVPFKVRIITVTFVFLMTFVIPLVLTLGMLWLKMISSLEMPYRNERIIPLFTAAVLFYITYYTLKNTGLFIDLQLFILGSTLLTLIAVFITYFSKISIHMLGIGGVAGALTALGSGYHVPVISILNLIFLFAGLLGFARLRLGAHHEWQIYGGFLTGFAVMAGLFLAI